MAVAAATGAVMAIGSQKFSTNLNQIGFGVEIATPEVTTFGSGQYQAFTAGIKTLKVDLGGFNDYAAGAVDEWLRNNYGNVHVVNLAHTGEATGSPAVITQALVPHSPEYDAKVGDVPGLSFSPVGAGIPIAQGQVTQASTGTITATGNTTPVNIGAASASQTVYAAINVLSVTGTTPSATFQLASSTTSGGAYTARGSAGAALTAVGGQWISAAGAFTDTWWRLNVTVSGTTPVFTVLATIAIL